MSKKFFRRITVIILVCFYLQTEIGFAIDYNLPPLEFDSPVGQQDFPENFGTDYLAYNKSTGELVYRVGEDGRWAPPDIGSISGLFDANIQLQPVPLWGTPSFHNDEEFDGVVVSGSSAVRIGFDRLAFWPFGPEHPIILRDRGLTRPPEVFSFGPILPKGQAKEVLSADLFAASYSNKRIELLVVPEPSALMLALCLLGSVLIVCRVR